jgi:transposase
MPAKLTDEQIQQKLIEGRNYKRLYTELKAMFDEVVADHKQCPKLLAEQKTYFESIVETQNARITELETMVFGRRPRGGSSAATKQPAGNARPASSYRRPLPPASAITSEEHHVITDCHRCGHELTDKDEAIRYEEDIVLAALTPEVPHKTVIKHTVERGWCSKCGQYSSARDLRGQLVTIGPVVRSLITYLVVQVDQTYAQAQNLLWQLYRFPVTTGEITNILAGRREAYLPKYEQLKTSVRAGPAHMDETSCPIQSEQGAGYAHVMVGADNTKAEHDVVYKFADSRGKGNSQELVGENYQGVGITDRYASYKSLFAQNAHQICWAHLQRTARDLTRLECLTKTKLQHVTAYYRELAAIYANIRTYQAEPFVPDARHAQAAMLLERVKELCVPHALDPKKLADLKAGILEYQDSLFICLTIDGIPADNNKAERSLRKLVIKRKKSFGVKTMKGARTMEVLLSVCQSLYNRDKDNFLPNLHALATAAQ